MKIACEVAAEGDALVAGNLSLTWSYLPDEPSSTDRVRALFDRQLEQQLDAGPPDFWIGETFGYLGEALLFVEGAQTTDLPVMVTMSFEQPVPRSYEGDTPAECARKLSDAGADVVGVNCLNGPKGQLPIATEMRAAVEGFVAAQPVAYRTSAEQPDFTALSNFPYELDPLQLSRREMAEFARQAREAGIDFMGSCCGSVQAHVRAMAKVLGKLPSEERAWKSEFGTRHERLRVPRPRRNRDVT